jgi:hypothetical protein
LIDDRDLALTRKPPVPGTKMVQAMTNPTATTSLPLGLKLGPIARENPAKTTSMRLRGKEQIRFDPRNTRLEFMKSYRDRTEMLRWLGWLKATVRLILMSRGRPEPASRLQQRRAVKLRLDWRTVASQMHGILRLIFP